MYYLIQSFSGLIITYSYNDGESMTFLVSGILTWKTTPLSSKTISQLTTVKFSASCVILCVWESLTADNHLSFGTEYRCDRTSTCAAEQIEVAFPKTYEKSIILYLPIRDWKWEWAYHMVYWFRFWMFTWIRETKMGVVFAHNS